MVRTEADFFSKENKVSKIFAIGGPIIDLKTSDTEFCLKYEIKTDAVIDIIDLKAEKETVLADLDRVNIDKSVVGGSILNTLRSIRQINSRIAIQYVAAVGADKNGRAIEEKLEENNIKSNLLRLSDRSTTFAYVFLNGGQRTIVTYRSASVYLTGEHLRKIPPVTNSVFLLSFYITDSVNLIFDDIYDLIGDNLFVLNLGCEITCLNADSGLLKKWLRRADIIIGNRTEFKALLSRFYGVDHSAENLKLFGEHKLVVQTDAENPVYFAYGGQVFEEPVKEIGLEKIDTCGSGDNFQAGLISELIESCDVQKAVQFGIVNAQKHIINKSKN